ncbi:MAG: long-chain fatty acid--CoA ligase [Gemmatimonadota bacterium]
MTFQDLAAELFEAMELGAEEPLSEPAFNDLALRVFRFQCHENQLYRGFVTRRGVNPEAVTSWREIPFLPTRAFKSAKLVSGNPGSVDRVFRTSGTTRGQLNRGEHHVLDLDLYRHSLLGNFARHLLRSTHDRMRILCLLPSSEAAPDSSLAFMMDEVVRGFGSHGSGFFVGPDGEIDEGAFWTALRYVERLGEPVLLAGTAFGFVRWLETGEKGPRRVSLPPGSRIMETGGYKGRSREVPREEFYEILEEGFGVGANFIVNEYGMTELLSQFYEPVLGGGEHPGVLGLADRYHRGPPWVRTLSLDPMTLDEVPLGERGILAHLDLANLGSVSAVLTEDLGRMVPGGFQLLGRNPGSEPRGCSLAMEDFLSGRGFR